MPADGRNDNDASIPAIIEIRPMLFANAHAFVDGAVHRDAARTFLRRRNTSGAPGTEHGNGKRADGEEKFHDCVRSSERKL